MGPHRSRGTRRSLERDSPSYPIRYHVRTIGGSSESSLDVHSRLPIRRGQREWRRVRDRR